MKIVQVTPGAGGMYCGGCFRDNALVAELRKSGHDVLMVPLYLPLTLDEHDQTAGTPIFFSGLNVFLEQKFAWFRGAPGWLHSLFTSPKLLRVLGNLGGKTRAEDLGALTVSMLRGEEGNQAREVDELTAWLKQHYKPDIACLSNVLLSGMARRIKAALEVPIVCSLQGEDTFLDGLPPDSRAAAWKLVAERTRDIDLLVAPSQYFAELMADRLELPAERVMVVANGINLDGYPTGPARKEPHPPTLGYFARMCAEKGLGMAVDVFIELKGRGRVKDLRFHVGGGCGPGDERYLAEQKHKLDAAGVLQDVAFFPNVTREEKIQFYSRLNVFSTPALYGEAFGLYVIEAMAAGVPAVQPQHGGFPEILKATGGGMICEPTVTALADRIETLLLNPSQAAALGEQGRQAVRERFSIAAMVRNFVHVLERAIKSPPKAPLASALAERA